MSFFQPEGCLIHTESNREALATPAGLERAMREGRILEGVVTLCDAALSLHLELGCAHGVIPHEEAVFCRDGERIKRGAERRSVHAARFRLLGNARNTP